MTTAYAVEPMAVAHPQNASFAERFAAREVRRYVYLRTGTLLPIVPHGFADIGSSAIMIGHSPGLAAQHYAVVCHRGKDAAIITMVAGGDDAGVLYGAYRFIEHLDVRFHLHGDVIPDKQVPLALPEIGEIGRPLFELRGLNPWGSHPFGFDLWDTDDWLAHIHQMAKMRMNFIGMHCYPEGHPYAEPTVWVGPPGAFDEGGRVTASYPSRYYNALFRPSWGGLTAKKTSSYHLGAAAIFDRDDWGPEVMRGHAPQPTTPEGCNALFNRTGAMFRQAFAFARAVGVKTCLGTETPLTIPRAVQERLKKQGKDPRDPAVVQEVYEGMFRRIAAAHPLDYYWLWTPENWTWRGNNKAQLAATVADVKLAHAALEKAGSPFRLATSGWVLGPSSDRAAFDALLPADIALSAISRHLGEDPVDEAYGRVKRREKWAIPWMEGDNGGLAIPQLWVGRTRQDAIDARSYGCTGLMGLIWRTRILSPNIAALAQAGWRQPWSGGATEPPVKSFARGGKVAQYPGAAIKGTDDDVLYQTCRYDFRGYDLPMPNGSYKVTLKFCEPHFDAGGNRVCDVTLQGKTVVQKLDIHGRVGQFAALDLSFDGVRVTDGMLRIGLAPVTSLPCISAIVVEGEGFARKINCGGPAWGGYEADAPSGERANPRMRKVACEDFYVDWATFMFGAEAGKAVAPIFARIDSRLPRPLSTGCPAGVKPDGRPWEAVEPTYTFVDELAAHRDKVAGAGARERFDYWLGTMRYLRAGARLDCAVGKLLPVLKKAKAEKDAARRKTLAQSAGVAAYRETLAAYATAFGHLLDTATTKGALATVIYWEHSFHPAALERPGRELAKLLGGPLPTDLQLGKAYKGKPRLIVPTVRTAIAPGETLTLKALVLGASEPVLRWRRMGQGTWKTAPFKHVARGAYQVAFPEGGAKFDLEYVVTAGDSLRFPAAHTQTLVLLPSMEDSR